MALCGTSPFDPLWCRHHISVAWMWILAQAERLLQLAFIAQWPTTLGVYSSWTLEPYTSTESSPNHTSRWVASELGHSRVLGFLWNCAITFRLLRLLYPKCAVCTLSNFCLWLTICVVLSGADRYMLFISLAQLSYVWHYQVSHVEAFA